jgi:hypothetical protein
MKQPGLVKAEQRVHKAAPINTTRLVVGVASMHAWSHPGRFGPIDARSALCAPPPQGSKTEIKITMRVMLAIPYERYLIGNCSVDG